MPQEFPVPTNIPAPDWIEGLELSKSPIAVNEMMGGQTSRLRLSAVQTGGKFVAQWYTLNLDQALAIKSFWTLVDSWDTVTLPTAFWSSLPVKRIQIYTAQSPTGFWLFEEPPLIQDLGGNLFKTQSVSIKLRAAID